MLDIVYLVGSSSEGVVWVTLEYNVGSERALDINFISVYVLILQYRISYFYIPACYIVLFMAYVPLIYFL